MRTIGTLRAPPRSPRILPINWFSLASSTIVVSSVCLLFACASRKTNAGIKRARDPGRTPYSPLPTLGFWITAYFKRCVVLAVSIRRLGRYGFLYHDHDHVTRWL